jgi:wobble nucleotide-excising tRNase
MVEERRGERRSTDFVRGALEAKLGALEWEVKDQKEAIKRLDEKIDEIALPLRDATVGFRLFRWFGMFVIAMLALFKTGDTSLIKSLFGGGG